MLQTEIKPDEDVIIEKPKTRARRIKKSVAARIRRKVVKQIKRFHFAKEEKEAQSKLEKQKNTN